MRGNSEPGLTPGEQPRGLFGRISHKHRAEAGACTLHASDVPEVICCLDRELPYEVNGEILYLEPRDLLVIPPHMRHRLAVREGETTGYYSFVFLSPVPLAGLVTPAQERQLRRAFVRPNGWLLLHLSALQNRELSQVLRRAEALLKAGGDDTALYFSVLSLQMFFVAQLCAAALQSKKDAEQSDKPEYSHLADGVRLYLDRHYAEPLILEDLAARFYVSKGHLSHEFKKATGCGVYQYILERRLEAAGALLRQGNAPVDVYSACGFNNYVSFFRAFKKRYGASPRAFFGAEPPDGGETPPPETDRRRT